MTKTLLKDTFREIKNTYSRFIAIFAIIALGISFFIGIKMAAPDMKLTADKYFKDNKLMDFVLFSNVGFNKEDIESLNKIEGIKGVMPSYSIDAIIDIEDVSTVVKINSLPFTMSEQKNENYMNRPSIVTGRLPNKSGECVIEENDLLDIKIGSKIKVESGDKTDILEKIDIEEFTVVGIINSPMYISKERGTTTIGNGKIAAFMSILESDFNMPVYTEIYINSNYTSEEIAYSKEYDEKIEPLKKALEKLALEREDIRYNQIKTDADKIIKEKEKEYNDGVLKRDKAILAGTKEIDDNQRKINSGNAELAKNKKIFINKISSSEAEIIAAEKKLNNGLNEYKANLTLFNKNKEAAILAGYYDAQKDVFLAQEEQLKNAKTIIDKSFAQLNTQKTALQSGKNKGYAEFNKNQKELNIAQSKINTAKKALETTKKETDQKFADARKELDKAKKKVNDIEEVKWYVLDRDTNIGYVDYGYAADRINSMAKVFPIIFVLVAMLICFTSINRLVEEQRTYIGTLKALGYKNTSIAFKYLTYATFASIIGGAIGIVIGFTVFPTFFINAYSAIYKLPKMILSFDAFLALAVLIGAIIVTNVAALMACFEILPQNAAKLMIPKAPKPGKTILLERIGFIWKRLKFTQKVTARNLFRYKSRFFMTVAGVMGCTALLLAAFGIRDAIGSIGKKQFEEIYKYQMSVSVKESLTKTETENIFNLIKKTPNFSSKLNLLMKSIDIENDGKERTCNIIVPEDIKDINNFISLNERVSGETIELNDTGVILTEKLAKMVSAKVGSNIYIKNGEIQRYTVKVIGISENYVEHYLYMSPNLYEKLYKINPEYNQINVKLEDASNIDEESISKSIIGFEGVAAISFTKDLLKSFDEIIVSLNYAVQILIISAGMLSFIVLYTLTNINISDRMRELATIKVLGFYEKEVASYVYRENIILTVIGSMFGLLMGFYLTKYIIGTVEVEMLMFGKNIYLLSFVCAVALTIAFSILVNIVLYKKIKDINMVEALKIVE